MPGSVSDSYDPEFGTAENGAAVADAIRTVRARITTELGSEELRNIVTVVREQPGPNPYQLVFSEQDLRVIRFCLDRSLESI